VLQSYVGCCKLFYCSKKEGNLVPRSSAFKMTVPRPAVGIRTSVRRNFSSRFVTGLTESNTTVKEYGFTFLESSARLGSYSGVEISNLVWLSYVHM
jgi:hypothetical protein